MVVGLSTLSSPTQKTNYYSRYRTSPRGVFFHVYIYSAATALSVYIKGESRWARAQLEWITGEEEKEKKTVCLRIYIIYIYQGQCGCGTQRSRQYTAVRGIVIPTTQHEKGGVVSRSSHSIYISFTEFTTVKYDWEQASAVCVAIPTSQAISFFYFLFFFGAVRGGGLMETKKKCWHHQEDPRKERKRKKKRGEHTRERGKGRSLD